LISTISLVVIVTPVNVYVPVPLVAILAIGAVFIYNAKQPNADVPDINTSTFAPVNELCVPLQICPDDSGKLPVVITIKAFPPEVTSSTVPAPSTFSTKNVSLGAAVVVVVVVVAASVVVVVVAASVVVVVVAASVVVVVVGAAVVVVVVVVGAAVVVVVVGAAVVVVVVAGVQSPNKLNVPPETDI